MATFEVQPGQVFDFKEASSKADSIYIFAGLAELPWLEDYSITLV